MAAAPAVEDGVFELTTAGARLFGSRCRACGNHTFPRQRGCPRCTETEMDTVHLAPRGTLWTWTIQGFPPKAPPYVGETDPASFEPFGVGYVELPDQVKVEARLTSADPDVLRIGMEMDLVLIPLGNTTTFAFAPVVAA